MAKAAPAAEQAAPEARTGNLDLIWNRVRTPDPARTKTFSRSGGFRGTATNATYLAQRATELFGPCGIGWGITVLDEDVIEGHPFLDKEGRVIGHSKVHKVHAKLWYIFNGERGEIEQFGQTDLVVKRSSGEFFTDEEAPKKSLTDAMTKCLSLLGFAADIHLGLFDDNKYVNDARQQFAAAEGDTRPEQEQRPATRDLGPKMTPAQHRDAIKKAVDEATCKRAFAIAWKQYEDPNDPAKKTEAQMKFKGYYDDRMNELHEAPTQPDPPPADDNRPFDEDSP